MLLKTMFVMLFFITDIFSLEKIEKTGFFSNEECIKKGHFYDCSLDSFVCGYEGCFRDYEPAYKTGDNFVLYVHKDRKYYKIDISNIKRYKLDKFISKNSVTISGDYNVSSNTIILSNIKTEDKI